jgi:hypothetical protein
MNIPKLAKRLMQVVFFLCLTSWLGLLEYFRRYSPPYPEIETGKVYAQNYHGYIVYLRSSESWLLVILPAMGIFIVIMMFVSAWYNGEELTIMGTKMRRKR